MGERFNDKLVFITRAADAFLKHTRQPGSHRQQVPERDFAFGSGAPLEYVRVSRSGKITCLLLRLLTNRFFIPILPK